MKRIEKECFDDPTEEESTIKSPRQKIISLEFSKIKTNFKRMYNNCEYSDIKFKFPKTSNTLYGHKVILGSNCEYFDKLFKSGMKEDKRGEIIIEDEDEKSFKKLVYFIYTGEIIYETMNDLLSLKLLSNKYMVNEIDELISKNSNSIELLNGMVEWVNCDLKRRYELFDSLISNIDFKKISHVELKEIYDSNEWISEHPTFLNTFLKKLISQVFRTTSFNPSLCSPTIDLSFNNTRATFNGSGWKGTILCTKSEKWAVRLVCKCTRLMVGLATTSFHREGNNYSRNGYYFYLYNGTLNSSVGDDDKEYYNQNANQDGSIIGVHYDESSGNITFYLNGKNLGIAYKNVTGDLYPAFDFYGTGACIELVPFQ